MNKKMKYQNGGTISNSYGAGVREETPRDMAMNTMATAGGLMGYMNGGSVLDPIMQKGGQCKQCKKK